MFVVLGFWCLQHCEFAVLGVGVLRICSFDVWDLQVWSFGVRFPVLEVGVLEFINIKGAIFFVVDCCDGARGDFATFCTASRIGVVSHL